MENRRAILDAAAGLLTYPAADYCERVRRLRDLLQAADADAAALAAAFDARVRDLSADAREELYTRTFDLNPVCSPEVGWHLFGENYSRGDFLVTMRQQLRRLHLPESCELPDHLSHVLPVVGRLEDDVWQPFVATYVLPALEKMIAALEGKDNPFESLLKCIRSILTGCRTFTTANTEGYEFRSPCHRELSHA